MMESSFANQGTSEIYRVDIGDPRNELPSFAIPVPHI